jgi:hypothetical protein
VGRLIDAFAELRLARRSLVFGLPLAFFSALLTARFGSAALPAGAGNRENCSFVLEAHRDFALAVRQGRARPDDRQQVRCPLCQQTLAISASGYEMGAA